MKLIAMIVAAVLGGGLTLEAIAKDSHHMMAVKDAMSTPDAKNKLDPKIRYFFRGEKYGEIAQDFGEFVSNKKTNALGKGDAEACNWVFLSAMLSFQDRVRDMGGNAVVDLRSF